MAFKEKQILESFLKTIGILVNTKNKSLSILVLNFYV